MKKRDNENNEMAVTQSGTDDAYDQSYGNSGNSQDEVLGASRGCSHGKQQHTHEYLGSVQIAEAQEDPHNHRFAGVTGQAQPLPGGGHFHKLEGNTDFYEDHFHIVGARTGPAVSVGDGRHVHFITGRTAVSDGHRHNFRFATLINDPIGD